MGKPEWIGGPETRMTVAEQIRYKKQRKFLLEPGAEKALDAARHALLAYTVVNRPDYHIAMMHRKIAFALEAIERGDNDRLMIFAPPQAGKSTISSSMFVSWYLGREPSKRGVVYATYQQDLAKDVGRRIRSVMTSPFHEATFPGACIVGRTEAAADHFELEAGGWFRAVGVDGALTGRPGVSLVVIDDPYKGMAEASSSTVRRHVQEWFESTVYTRGAALVLISTRWHQDDLAGHLLRKAETGEGEAWDVVLLPAIAADGTVLETHPNAPIAKMGIERFRENLTARAFQAMYQQRPAAPEGAIFKRAAFKRWTDATLPKKFDLVVWSWDLKLKDTSSGSYVCGQCWGRAGTAYYLLDQIRGRWGFAGSQARILEAARSRPRNAVLVEDAATGPAAIQMLRAELDDVVPIAVRGSKVQRAEAIAAKVEGGNVYVPDGAAWLDEWLDELSVFPHADNDDQVDAMTQAIQYLSTKVRAVVSIAPSIMEKDDPWL